MKDAGGTQRFRLGSTAVGLLPFLLVGCSAPEPFVEILELPRILVVGQASTFVFRLTNKAARARKEDHGILDITFEGDWVSVAIPRLVDRWDARGVYPRGSTIYHSINGEMPARDLLVSAEATQWDTLPDRTLRLSVTPSRTGKFVVCVGAAFVLTSSSLTKKPEMRYPVSKATPNQVNQQGHPCVPFPVEAR